MSGDDTNVYINFALYAVLGRLAEADHLMDAAGDQIRRVASELCAQFPVAARPLYRGMLVDPGVEVKADPRYKFLSWSEDPDVACWFASRESAISDYVVEHRPGVRGVVLSLPCPPQRVLFHYSWGQGWDRLARRHPHMGSEGARQVAWSLRTQREVITEPLDVLPPALPVEDLDPPPVSILDRRLAPPWML